MNANTLISFGYCSRNLEFPCLTRMGVGEKSMDEFQSGQLGLAPPSRGGCSMRPKCPRPSRAVLLESGTLQKAEGGS
jgi:hypothetical protein